MDRFLRVVEHGGNAHPHPASLFAILSLAVVVLSGVAAHFDLSVIHPTTGELVATVNLLSVGGLHKILTGLVTNFTGVAPLGTVVSVMLPYSVVFLIGWAFLFAAWIALGWPVGPGAPLHYVPAGN